VRVINVFTFRYCELTLNGIQVQAGEVIANIGSSHIV